MQNESDPNAAGKADDDSLSEEGLIALFDQEPEEETETTEEEESNEAEETEEAEEESTEEAETEEEAEESDEEAGGINLDELTDEQWETVRTKLKSRAAADIRRLKRENEALKNQVSQQASQPNQSTAQPEPAESPLLKGVETSEQLTAKATELKKMAKAIEALLDDNEDASLDEIIENGGQSYTKRQWKSGLRNIRDALDEAIPYKAHVFRQEEQWAAEGKHWEETAARQVPAIGDENSTIGKLHHAMMGDPRIEKIRKASPELIPQLSFLLAHAANSIEITSTKGKKSPAKEAAPTTTGTKVKAKPPASPSGVAASAPKAGDPKAKVREVKEKRFHDSGDPEDLIAAWS